MRVDAARQIEDPRPRRVNERFKRDDSHGESDLWIGSARAPEPAAISISWVAEADPNRRSRCAVRSSSPAGQAIASAIAANS
jgi:hypothetical protein